MHSKLTLTIEDSVIKKAKRYAKSRGRSLSDIIENYLKMITRDPRIADKELTPLVISLKGTFKAPEDLDYKEELTKGLSKKYLRDAQDID
jgi:hypothetical protein